MATCGKCKAEGVSIEHVRQCFGVKDTRPSDRAGDPTWQGDSDPFIPHTGNGSEFDDAMFFMLEDGPAPEEDEFPGEVSAMPFQNQGRIDLNVPFSEKDKAKELGARWDRGSKIWYFPNGKPSDAPESWLEAPKHEPPREDIKDGFYEIGEGVFKVLHSQSGNQYAKVMNTASGRWDYAPGKIMDLREKGQLLELDRAKELGKLYGICMVCGATLTNETSIEAGIGPICASKFE